MHRVFSALGAMSLLLFLLLSFVGLWVIFHPPGVLAGPVTVDGRPYVAWSGDGRLEAGELRRTTLSSGGAGVQLMTAVSVPYWALALGTTLCGVLSGWWLRNWQARRRLERAGLCPACGYDLRASPDRCPECGARPAPASTTTAAS
jgi:hypothetical protein